MSSREAVGWIFFVPGNTQPDAEIDAPHRLQLEGQLRQTLGPFRRIADAKGAETSDTSE
jgi:hypothetical protein